jgi:hypothetical protein
MLLPFLTLEAAGAVRGYATTRVADGAPGVGTAPLAGLRTAG